MSFASLAKEEICALKTDRKCCAVAECCGILLYCNAFTPEVIRICTANGSFSERLPKLFKKAFGIAFDTLPPDSAKGKRTFTITAREKIDEIRSVLGEDGPASVTHHVNFAMLENECCRAAFLRGAFLAGGSVTDPEKAYHLELATGHKNVAGETFSLLLEMGFFPKESFRGGNCLLYFKQSDAISDVLATVGAPVTAMQMMTAKVEKEMRNKITRQINCDSANTDKTVSAAREQINAIKRYAAKFGLDTLPDHLKDAALLRIANPEVSLADLSRLSFPSVSKSCLSHRLRKIAALSELESLPGADDSSFGDEFDSEEYAGEFIYDDTGDEIYSHSEEEEQ